MVIELGALIALAFFFCFSRLFF